MKDVKLNQKQNIPEMVFKYKAITTREDVIRFYDIVRKKRLFFPTVKQLNDPFEGIICPRLGGIMGIGISDSVDEDHSSMGNIKEKSHVLSLSADCFSPQLWAYYCLDYHGVAFCFYTNNSLTNIKKVKYKKEESIIEANEELDWEKLEQLSIGKYEKLFLNSLLMKETGWKYEKEWRLIEASEKKQYIRYRKEELAAIIIGHNLDDETKGFIKSTLPKGFPVFKTCPGYRTGKVHLLKYDCEKEYNGSIPDFIDTVDDLMEAINNY